MPERTKKQRNLCSKLEKGKEKDGRVKMQEEKEQEEKLTESKGETSEEFEKFSKKDEEELKAKIEEEFAKLKVEDVVVQTMFTLSSLGYQKLGLPEEQNEKLKDLNQAKLAIDALDALVKIAEGSLGSDEISAFKNTLANLQLSYVKATE